MDGVPKWTCPMCTYANWPKSRKCTVCFALRDLPRIEDEMRRIDMAALNPSAIGCLPADVNANWTCHVCTFINSPSTERCIQCGVCPKITVPVVQYKPRDHSVSCVATAANDEAHAQAGLTSIVKWQCSACTYDNWPKSKKCVMCHTPTNADAEKKAKGSSMTEGSDQETTTTWRDLLWLDACEAVVSGEVAPVEKFLNGGANLLRKLTVRDCCLLDRWGNTNRRADTSDRQLPSSSASNPKCTDMTDNKIPNSLSSPFKPNLTLLELAKLVKRTDLLSLFSSLPESQEANISSTLKEDLIPPISSSGRSSQQQCPGFHNQRSSPELPRHRRFFSKRSPCQSSPYSSKELRRVLAAGLRQRKGEFPCDYLSDWGTFVLPTTIYDLSPVTQRLLFSELLDTEAQIELEERSKAINWWVTGGQRPTSHLFALWNRTDGDCLLDSLLQASWGIFDKAKTLRQALSESLTACEPLFYRIWRDYETVQAADHYRLDELQLLRDWRSAMEAANQPRGSLEQIHIFVLCHILRRPVVVYGVKYINNYRDEPIGISNFQGIYLPQLWERAFCSRNPLILGYTRGHFTALVPMQPTAGCQGLLTADSEAFATGLEQTSEAASFNRNEGSLDVPHTWSMPDSVPIGRTHSSRRDELAFLRRFPIEDCTAAASATVSIGGGICSAQSTLSSIYLPLFDRHGQPLPIHFVSERDSPNALLHDHLEVVTTRRGLSLTRLRLTRPHHLVETILEDWLAGYRNLPEMCVPILTAATGQRHEDTTSS